MTSTNDLFSDDAAARNEALKALVGERDAVLLVMTDQGTQLTHTAVNGGVLSRVFTSLVWAAQEFGRGLGLQLSWVAPPQKHDDIVVAGPNGVLR